MLLKSDPQRTLFILGAISFVFCFVIIPMFIVLENTGYGSQSIWDEIADLSIGGFLKIGGVSCVPSVIYWVAAREMCLNGKTSWTVFLAYLLLVVPLTFVLVAGVIIWSMSRMVI